MISQRIKELGSLDKHLNKEGIMVMLASEESLKKDWDNELDEAWDNF